MSEQKIVQIEKAEQVKVPKLVTLYFQRTDNPNKTVSIKTTMEDSMERVVALMAKKLGLNPTAIGVLGAGEPVEFAGKTVGEVLREHNTDTFQLTSAEMLGEPSTRRTGRPESASSAKSGSTGKILILDFGDGDLLRRLAEGNRVLLTGRSVAHLDEVRRVAEDVILCEECSRGVEFDRKVTYAGQAELLKAGDAKVVIEVDKESFVKVLAYLNLLGELMNGAIPLESKGIGEGALGTDVGELWCTNKHLEEAIIASVEVIEKAIRENVDKSPMLEVLEELWECYFWLDEVIAGRRRDVEKLVDTLRRIRAKAGTWLNGVRTRASRALKEDFLKVTGHIAHAEEHLVKYLTRGECITCAEDMEVGGDGA